MLANNQKERSKQTAQGLYCQFFGYFCPTNSCLFREIVSCGSVSWQLSTFSPSCKKFCHNFTSCDLIFLQLLFLILFNILISIFILILLANNFHLEINQFCAEGGELIVETKLVRSRQDLSTSILVEIFFVSVFNYDVKSVGLNKAKVDV